MRKIIVVDVLVVMCKVWISFNIFGLPFTASQYCFGKVLPV